MAEFNYTPNTWSARLPFDNCYDYAVGGELHGRDDGLFSMPGQTRYMFDGFRMLTLLNDSRATVLNEADGLQYAGKGASLPPKREGHYLVAMYLAPIDSTLHSFTSGREILASTTKQDDALNRAALTGDFHYVRQDADGGWSEKRGAFAVTKFQENNGALPRSFTAANYRMGINTQYHLQGYYYVPEGGVDVGTDVYFERVLSGKATKQTLPPTLQSIKELARITEPAGLQQAFRSLAPHMRNDLYYESVPALQQYIPQSVVADGVVEKATQHR